MNVQITGTTYDSRTVSLGAPLELTLSSSLNRPYEEIDLRVLPTETTMQYIRVTVDGAILFEGTVLDQKVERTEKRATRFLCRSTPGYVLSEKQVNPYVYFQVSGQSIVNQYAVPYGVKGVQLPSNQTVSRILVSEKQSYWDYLIQFFMQAYGKVPYLRRDGYIYLTTYTGQEYSISNKDAGAIRYLTYQERYHTRGLAKIYFQTGSDDFGNLYEESYTNAVAVLLGCQKESYLNPTRSWVLTHQRYASYLFYKSMADSHAVEAVLPGYYPFEPGDRVSFQRTNGNRLTLYVGENKIVAGEKGITTTVTLWDPNRNSLI